MRELPLTRILEHGAVGAHGDRQIGCRDGKALDDLGPFAIRFGVEHRVRNAVAPEEVLQPHQICAVTPADEHGARASLDERHPAQDERAHQQLAHFRLADDQRADMRGIERHRLTAFRRRARFDERGAARKLTQFACHHPREVPRDVVAVTKRVLPRHCDVTRQHEPRRRSDFPEVNDDFIRPESAWRAAEAFRGVDLRGHELRKHLLAALLENGGGGKRHDASPTGFLLIFSREL